jgi:dihydroorotate dehydrogenase electron transfer subunit
MVSILMPMLDTETRVREIQDLGAGNYLLTLRTPEQARLTQAGQFFMIKCTQDIRQHPILRRPFSVFNIRRQGKSGKPMGIELLVKDVGLGTHLLANLKPGARINALGPQGRGYQLSPEMIRTSPRVCLVAGGVGIAALYLLAGKLQEMGVSPVLFYGGRTAADLVLRNYFEDLGIETFYTTEDGSLGERGQVTLVLERFLAQTSPSRTKIYTCGPWGMMKAVHHLATRFKLDCEASLEARMGCSLGACMGCVIRGWDDDGAEQYMLVCKEGPIISSRVVDWETEPL